MYLLQNHHDVTFAWLEASEAQIQPRLELLQNCLNITRLIVTKSEQLCDGAFSIFSYKVSKSFFYGGGDQPPRPISSRGGSALVLYSELIAPGHKLGGPAAPLK